jgi:flagellar basal body rod protein FlgF
MFGSNNNKKKSDENASLATSSARGNMDEYEALRTIVAENAGLLGRVFEKIRKTRAMSKGSKTDIPAATDNKGK